MAPGYSAASLPSSGPGAQTEGLALAMAKGAGRIGNGGVEGKACMAVTIVLIRSPAARESGSVSAKKCEASPELWRPGSWQEGL